MAKRKNAAALFEVIHADKRLSSRNGGWALPQFPSPLGWWSRRRSNGSASRAASASESIGAPAEPSHPSRLWSFLASKPRLGLALDPDTQVVSFELNYTTALIAAFSVFAIVALAFVVGKQMTRRVAPALADQTTDELRSGPAQPNVLDVGSDSAPMAMATSPLRNGSTPPAVPVVPTNKPVVPQTAHATWTEPPKGATTFVDLNQKRTVDLQYVLMQSYPEKEKAMAEAACQMLNKNGILCTVEFNTYYSPNWYAVVGVVGFDRIRNSPEYDAYIDRIQQVSDRFAEKSRFKKFEPKPFKWRQPKAVG